MTTTTAGGFLSPATTVAITCYTLATLPLLGFGVVYMVRSTPMPHHRQALGIDWTELDAGVRVLLLAGLRLAGAGMAGSAIAMLAVLAIPFADGELWARLLVPALGLAVGGTSLRVTLMVRRETGAQAPAFVPILGMSLYGVAFVASWF
jgi:hypothetical protein